MDFQVLYTESSLVDLEALLAWSWNRHPGHTEQFANTLLSHVELLDRFPLMGTPLRGSRAIRRLLHTPFHVYYRTELKHRRVEILHSWHISRKPPEF